MPLKIRTKPSNPKYREGYEAINWRCSHPETDTCTGPAGDPRVGKEICIECGEPIEPPNDRD